MRLNLQHIQNLLIEKVAGTISEEDNHLVERAIADDNQVREMWEDIKFKLNSEKSRAFLNNLDENKAWKQVEYNLQTSHNYWPKAAAVILILALGVSFFFFWRKPVETGLTKNKQEGVRLELANGKTIGLDENTGTSIDLGAVELNLSKKALYYTSTENTAQQWNTLVVPVTEDYKVVLSDGTEVWLNAASSLRFSFSFSDTLREVYLAGEAFFKVTKNAKKPFIVHAGTTRIRVLGTSFNVNAYSGNITSTSLIEGSVMATAGNSKVILKPGFQASFIGEAGFKTEPFDEEVVLSWINGIYYFHDQALSDITKILQRWFDVKVVFQSNEAAAHKFSGRIEKNKPLQVFISNLEVSSDIQADLKQGTLYIK